MTKVLFYKRDGYFCGFEEKGHTGYADSGNDILCAALSAMTMLIINTVEISYSADVNYTIDESTTNVKLVVKEALPEYSSDEKRQYAVSGLIQGYYYQLNDLVEEYYEYLEVDITEDFEI